MMIKVKNHQIPPTILVDKALGISSDPEITYKRLAKHRQWPQLFVFEHLSHAEKCLNVIAIDKAQNQVTFKKKNSFTSKLHLAKNVC